MSLDDNKVFKPISVITEESPCSSSKSPFSPLSSSKNSRSPFSYCGQRSSSKSPFSPFSPCGPCSPLSSSKSPCGPLSSSKSPCGPLSSSKSPCGPFSSSKNNNSSPGSIVYDEHTICIKKYFSFEEITVSIENCIKQALEIDNTISKEYFLKYPEEDEGKDNIKYMNFIYIFFKDKKIYHLLMGKNTDGSKRETIKYKENYDYSAPCPEIWADEDTDDDIEEIIQEGPLLFMYNENEIIDFERAFVYKNVIYKGCEFSNYILFVKNEYKFITKEKIYDIFKIFNTKEKKYPIIENLNETNYQLIFDKNTYDALFAYLLCNKVIFENDIILNFKKKIVND